MSYVRRINFLLACPCARVAWDFFDADEDALIRAANVLYAERRAHLPLSVVCIARPALRHVIERYHWSATKRALRIQLDMAAADEGSPLRLFFECLLHVVCDASGSLVSLDQLYEHIPMDVVVAEIWPRLTVSEQRAWRVADRRIAAATRAPLASEPWYTMLTHVDPTLIAQLHPRHTHPTFDSRDSRRTAAFILQLAHDDFVTAFRKGGFAHGLRSTSLVQQAAAMAGAARVFRLSDYTLETPVSCDILRRAAIAGAPSSDILDILPSSPFSVDKIINADLEMWLDPMLCKNFQNSRNGRKNILRCTSIPQTWAEMRRWDLVDALLEKQLDQLLVTCAPLFYTIAAHGHVRLLSLVNAVRPTFWKPSVVSHIIHSGSDAASLEWFRVNRPDCLPDGEFEFGLPRIMDSANRWNNTSVIEWIVAHGYVSAARVCLEGAHCNKNTGARMYTWLRREWAVITGDNAASLPFACQKDNPLLCCSYPLINL